MAIKKESIKALFLVLSVAALSFFMNKYRFSFRYFVFPLVLIFAPPLLDKTFKSARVWLPTTRGFKLFFCATLAVILIYPPLFFFYFVVIEGSTFSIPTLAQIDKAISKGLLAVLVAAVPEEFFFRAYLQEHVLKRFNKTLVKPLTFKNLLVSILFGLFHAVAFLDISRVVTFFPSLLFGLFTEKSGGKIFYSLLFHLVSNFLAFLLWTFI